MKKELEEKIVRDHPLLFADRYKDPHQTCMCFGLECGDGWYDLIYEACSKIEPLIEKFLKENKSSKCGQCTCDISKHKPYRLTIVDSDKALLTACSSVHSLPYHWGGWGYSSYAIIGWKRELPESFKSWSAFTYFWKYRVYKQWLVKRIKNMFFGRCNRFFQTLFDKFGIHQKKPCCCKGFELIHPRASQIKEKFGTLRFYMAGATDEIYKIISEAERKSEKTCECCGEPGELRTQGWHFTLCDECNIVREETGRAPWL